MSARSHTANSWARVNHDLQFRSIIEKVEALSEETRKTKQMEAETHQMVQYLQARLHALAAAVAELPGVFQSSVAEIIAEQERLHADLQLCRQQMREHKAEVTAMLIDVRQACGTAVAADHTRASERVAALEAQVEAAVATQQRLHLEAVEWNKTRRRLEHVEARGADVREQLGSVRPRLDGAESSLTEHAAQLRSLAGGVAALEHEWTRRRNQARPR